VIYLVIPSHLRGLHKDLIDLILAVALVILIGKTQLGVLSLHILKQGYKLLEFTLAIFALPLLDTLYHVIDLFKAHVSLIFLAYK
jgi:hypothetical protein